MDLSKKKRMKNATLQAELLRYARITRGTKSCIVKYHYLSIDKNWFYYKLWDFDDNVIAEGLEQNFDSIEIFKEDPRVSEQKPMPEPRVDLHSIMKEGI